MSRTEPDPRLTYAGAVLASITGKCPRDCPAYVDIPDGFCDGGCNATPAECWTRLVEGQGHNE